MSTAPVIFWLMCGVVAAVIGSAKNRNVFGWFVLGALFGTSVLIVVVQVSIASPASADPYDGPRTGGGDAEFLYLSKSHIAGLSNKDGDAGLTGLGKALCRDLDEGASRESLFLKFVQGHGWSDSDASWMLTSAVVSYCPAYIVPSDRW